MAWMSRGSRTTPRFLPFTETGRTAADAGSVETCSLVSDILSFRCQLDILVEMQSGRIQGCGVTGAVWCWDRDMGPALCSGGAVTEGGSAIQREGLRTGPWGTGCLCTFLRLLCISQEEMKCGWGEGRGEKGVKEREGGERKNESFFSLLNI